MPSVLVEKVNTEGELSPMGPATQDTSKLSGLESMVAIKSIALPGGLFFTMLTWGRIGKGIQSEILQKHFGPAQVLQVYITALRKTICEA